MTSTGDAEFKLLEAAKSGEIDVVTAILHAHPHLVNCKLNSEHYVTFQLASYGDNVIFIRTF